LNANDHFFILTFFHRHHHHYHHQHIISVAAHFETKFRAETVRKGHEARLKCEAIGDKPLTITWMKDKMSFNVRDESRYELTETATEDGVTSEVLIKTADRRDSALFTCVTFNSHG